MKLIVARHGITESNQRGLANGQYDEPLSPEGMKDVRNLVRQLHGLNLDAIYSSSLKRATETAEPIAKDHKLELTADSRLIEVDIGGFTHKPFTTSVPIFGKDISELLNTYTYNFKNYGGENASEVEQRVQSFLEDLMTKSHQNVLIITHGGILRWFYLIIKNKKVGLLSNLSLHKFELK